MKLFGSLRLLLDSRGLWAPPRLRIRENSWERGFVLSTRVQRYFGGCGIGSKWCVGNGIYPACVEIFVHFHNTFCTHYVHGGKGRRDIFDASFDIKPPAGRAKQRLLSQDLFRVFLSYPSRARDRESGYIDVTDCNQPHFLPCKYQEMAADTPRVSDIPSLFTASLRPLRRAPLSLSHPVKIRILVPTTFFLRNMMFDSENTARQFVLLILTLFLGSLRNSKLPVFSFLGLQHVHYIAEKANESFTALRRDATAGHRPYSCSFYVSLARNREGETAR